MEKKTQVGIQQDQTNAPPALGFHRKKQKTHTQAHKARKQSTHASKTRKARRHASTQAQRRTSTQAHSHKQYMGGSLPSLANHTWAASIRLYLRHKSWTTNLILPWYFTTASLLPEIMD